MRESFQRSASPSNRKLLVVVVRRVNETNLGKNVKQKLPSLLESLLGNAMYHHTRTVLISSQCSLSHYGFLCQPLRPVVSEDTLWACFTVSS